MKSFLCLVVGLLSTFSLSGCIGENYDFNPPSVTFSTDDVTQSYELEEANISWRGENSKPIEKETKDFLAFAEKQEQMRVSSEQPVNILFGHGDFELQELTVTVWKGNEKRELKVEQPNRTFNSPKEKGEYVVEVNLRTDSGYAQYVANIDIR